MKKLNNDIANGKRKNPPTSPSKISGGNGGGQGNKKPVSAQKGKPAKKAPVKASQPAKRPDRLQKSVSERQKKPSGRSAAPQRPVDKRMRRAADKAAGNKQAAVKKNKYHGGNYILYYIFVGIIVVLVLIVLANTVLFRCKNITVTGNARYSVEEIIAASGLEQGQNLLHVNRNGAAEKIVSALAYIDSAKVKRSFPSTIEVSVEEAERRFAVREGAVTAAVSYGGKIVDQGTFPELPLVAGMECESVEIGSRLKSKVEGKNDIPDAVLDAAESAMMNNISKIDITDRFSLEMELDNGRIIIRLGTASDLENKVKIAKEFVDTEVGETESVTIIVSNPTRVTLRTNVPSEEPGTPGSGSGTTGSGSGTTSKPEMSGGSGNSSVPGTSNSSSAASR